MSSSISSEKLSMLNVSKTFLGTDWEQEMDHWKASIRYKRGHPFLSVKRQFGSVNLIMCVRGGRAKEFFFVCLG